MIVCGALLTLLMLLLLLLLWWLAHSYMHRLCYQCAQQHRIQPLPTCRQQLLAIKQRAAGLDAVEKQRIRKQVATCAAWPVSALHSRAGVLLLQQLLLLLLLLVPWRAGDKAPIMLRLRNIDN
jgi:hypothetical protein